MKRKIIFLVSLIAMTFVSCQKDNEEFIADNHTEEIKQLEETLGMKFKEIPEENIGDAIFISYEDLKKYMEDAVLSRADGNPKPVPTRSFSVDLNLSGINRFSCSIENVRFCTLFNVDFLVEFVRRGSNSFNTSALLDATHMSMRHPTGSQSISLGSTSSNNGYIRTMAHADFKFYTIIGNKTYEFFSSITFDFKFPLASTSGIRGEVSISIGFTFR